jgi:tyrosyl-tRNA synthetase
MFGKLMSVPDELMADYFSLCTDVDPSGVVGVLPPQEAKRRLGIEIVSMFHGPEAAEAARDHFDRVFRSHEIPTDVEDFEIPADCVREGVVHLPALLRAAGLAPSTSEARRVITQGGLHVNGAVLDDVDVPVEKLRGQVVRVGKRRFVRLV